jgi:hypothetical protein
MKIRQLLSGFDIAITNDEHQFMERHTSDVKLTSLDEHDQWIAQTLVRKGVYTISKDNTTLIKNLHETNR